MQSLLNKARKLFKTIDVFGAPVTLNIDGQTTYRSAMGGLMSLLMIVIVVVIFTVNYYLTSQFQVIIFLSKLDINVKIQSIFSSYPQLITLNENNFFFAVSIDQTLSKYNFIDRPFYKIVLTQENSTSTDVTQFDISQIDLIPCTLQRFNDFKQAQGIAFEDGDIYNEFKMDLFLCPPEKFNLTLNSSYGYDTYKYVQFQVVPCQNVTNNSTISSWNPVLNNQQQVCAESDYVFQQLLNDNGFLLQILTTNFAVNPEKPSNITKIYMQTEMSLFFQPDIQVIQETANFRNYVVDTDNSLFISTEIQSQTWSYREPNSATFQTSLNVGLFYNKIMNLDQLNQSQNQRAVSVIFQSDNISFLASRKFTKIGDVISYIGGIFQVFFLIFGIFIKPYNNSFLKLRLANKLYDFNEAQTSPETQQQQQVDSQVQRTLNPPRNIENRENIQLNDLRNRFKTRGEYLINYFDNLIFKRNKITFSVDYLLYTIFCRKFHKNKKNDTICSAYQKIDDDMNVRHILNQGIKLDRLKKLILTNHQIVLFNSLPKSQFALKKKQLETTTSIINKHREKNDTQQNNKRRKIEEHEDYTSFQIILHAFDKIINTPTTDETTQEINKKLVISLGAELISVLQQSLQVKEQDEFNSQQLPIHILQELDEYNVQESPIQIHEQVNHKRINYPSSFSRVNNLPKGTQLESYIKKYQQTMNMGSLDIHIPGYGNKYLQDK